MENKENINTSNISYNGYSPQKKYTKYTGKDNREGLKKE
jgi:hypothetical protein